MPPYLALFFNPHLLELPLSRTSFHGPKGVRAIEVRLYTVSGAKPQHTFHTVARPHSTHFVLVQSNQYNQGHIACTS